MDLSLLPSQPRPDNNGLWIRKDGYTLHTSTRWKKVTTFSLDSSANLLDVTTQYIYPTDINKNVLSDAWESTYFNQSIDPLADP